MSAVRTPRQYAADWGNRVRADMRKARDCRRWERSMESVGDHSRAAVYRRMCSSYVAAARANNRRRVAWLLRARWRDAAAKPLPSLLRRQAG